MHFLHPTRLTFLIRIDLINLIIIINFLIIYTFYKKFVFLIFLVKIDEEERQGYQWR
ncbi:hypothetical protein NEOC65_002430 [Neochlamydia sp. AcF65]|nr:hypothetical protein [Neochlamydia sp. AcF65]